jgi:phage tail-like protein
MPQQRHDPYKNFNFRVEIDGIASAEFSEASGLESETVVIDYRTGGERITRKRPGLTKFGNVVLRRGITQNADLWNWRQTVVEGRVERKNGSVIVLDDDGTEVVRWNFRNGWIAKWVGPSFNAASSDVAIETIEIAHEGLELAD